MKRSVATAVALALVAGVVIVSLAGCYRQRLPEDQRVYLGDGGSTGTWTTDSPAIPLAGATSLEATVRMAAGELTLKSGGSNALDGVFQYRPKAFKPQVSYEVVDAATGIGRLTVEQSEFRADMLGNGKNDWSVRLATGVPLDLNVDLGAGEAVVKLGGLDVRDLTMNMGAGDATVDFSGAWSHDVSARIQAGVGRLTLRLPQDVGVRVSGGKPGIGEFVADDGFTADGDTFVNRAYGQTTTAIEISVKQGIGEIRLETVR